ncbi:hypothetical protein FQR65_LT02457 [Abscondita terminalis]|nr:hypothetical protein FQR65_LT02457 [Abscondita terminalis]
MNALLVLLVVAASAVNAGFISAPAALSEVTLKGPASRTTMLRSDGLGIDTAVDTGAISSTMMSSVMTPTMMAAPGFMATKAFMTAPGFYGTPAAYMGIGLDDFARGFLM